MADSLALTSLSVKGYRSLRDFRIPLGRVTVVTGANGAGKSNLYQALLLLSHAVRGRLAQALADEGGMSSVVWAGGERIRFRNQRPRREFTIGIEAADFRFEFTAGLRPLSSLPLGSMLFVNDPDVKRERLWLGRGLLLDRRGPSGWVRDREGAMREFAFSLLSYESVLSQVVDLDRYPEVSLVRRSLLDWRFYHHFRTDPQSPLRHAQAGVQTNALSHDGADLAAALGTILAVGEAESLQETIAAALGGAEVAVTPQFTVQLHVPGLERPLEAREFSDGQLRFLCLCAALYSPRPPALLALNEPEMSLHPDLYPSLARLIARAARYSQIWMTTHSRELAAAVAEAVRVTPIELTRIEGETWIAGTANTPRRPHRELHFDDEEDEGAL